MNINAVSPTISNFHGTKTTENGNVYHTTHTATTIGLLTGAALAGALVRGQVKSLKTIEGKKSLLEPYHQKGKYLKDIMEKQVDDNGKVIFEKNGATKRSNKIARRFINAVIGWGALFTGATTGIGFLADKNTELARSRMADGYIKPAKYY